MEVIGVVHLPPLPSSPNWRGRLEEVLGRAVRDARALEIGGVDAILIENYGDYPYKVRVDALTVTVMTRVVSEIVSAVNVKVGVSVLRNSAPEAIAIALATGATFVRSNQWCWTSDAPEGLLTPVVHEGIEVMRKFGRKVDVIADVRVKHASPISNRSLCDEARDLGHRCMASAIAVSGSATGEEADPKDVEVAKACSNKPVYVASGVTLENVDKYFMADGVIVGTYFKEGGVTTNPVDVLRVRRFVNKVR